MKKLFGIVYSDEGNYIMAAMQRTSAALPWSCSALRRWPDSNSLRRILLLHRGVYFGINSSWIPGRHDVPFTEMSFTIDRSPEDSASTSLQDFEPVAHTANLSLYTQAFQNNLLGVVPQDIFLATIPKNMFKGIEESFISFFVHERYILIGIVLSGNLRAVFTLSPGTAEKLSVHLGRVKRFWEFKYTHEVFPRQLISIGAGPDRIGIIFEKPPLHLLETETDINSLRAMGTALAQQEKTVPRFAAQAPEASGRMLRTSVYALSLLLIILGICGIVLFSGLNYWDAKAKAEYEQEYQSVIVNNQEIKSLTQRNNELAETILRLEDTFTRQTIWGQFLHEIGEKKPADLYFERFGSEPIAANNAAIRIALAGWTPRETSVTQFIGILQNMPYVTQITLSSMERDKKKQSIYGFKILCTLLLNAQ